MYGQSGLPWMALQSLFSKTMMKTVPTLVSSLDAGRTNARKKPQQIRIHQRVIDHDVGARDQFRATQSQQTGVSRPGADQVNHAFGFHVFSSVVIYPVHRNEADEIIHKRNSVCASRNE